MFVELLDLQYTQAMLKTSGDAKQILSLHRIIQRRIVTDL